MPAPHAPAPSLNRLSAEHLMRAHAHIDTIRETLRSLQQEETTGSASNPEVSPALHSMVEVRSLSQELISALEARGAEGASEESQAMTSHVIDVLKALPSFVGWIEQGNVPRGASPELVVAALRSMSNTLHEAKDLIREVHRSHPSPLDQGEVPVEQVLASLQPPQKELCETKELQQGLVDARSSGKAWWDISGLQEWIQSLRGETGSAGPALAVLTTSGATIVAMKLLAPEANVWPLVATAALAGLTLLQKARVAARGRGVAWNGGGLHPHRELSFCTDGAGAESRIGSILGSDAEILKSALFVTNNYALSTNDTLVSIEGLLRGCIESAENEEARTSAQEAYDAWYPVRRLRTDPNFERARISLPVKADSTVCLPVPRGWELTGLSLNGQWADTSVRNGVLGGALVKIPRGVNKVVYVIEPQQSPVVPTREMVETLQSLLPSIPPTSRGQEVSKILDAQGLSGHERARAHLAAMTFLRFYYTQDPLVGRAQKGANEHALRVLAEMRCGNCDGLSALLARWQREDSLTVVTSRGLVTDGYHQFLADAGHALCTVVSEDEGFLDLDPSATLPSIEPFSTHIAASVRTRVLRASKAADESDRREISAVRVWHGANLDWRQRRSYFPESWDFAAETRRLLITMSTDVDHKNSWKAGALVAQRVDLLGEQERCLALARQGDFKALVPWLADAHLLHTGAPDESARTTLKSLQQLLVTEFLRVGLPMADRSQKSAFLGWLTSSFAVWVNEFGSQLLPDEGLVTPQFLADVLHKDIAQQLTSKQLVSLATLVLRGTARGVPFQDVRELLACILRLQQRMGQVDAATPDKWSLVEAHLVALTRLSSRGGLSDHDRVLLRSWCREWLALDATPQESVWHGVHQTSFLEMDTGISELLGDLDLILFQRDSSGSRGLAPRISKLLQAEPYQFTRTLSARTVQFFQHLRENVTVPTELDAIIYGHTLRALDEVAKTVPYLTIPELRSSGSPKDPVSALYFELSSCPGFAVEIAGTRQGKLLTVRKNLLQLVQAGLVDLNQIRERVPTGEVLSPTKAMEQLFEFSSGKIGTGLYLRGATARGAGVNIVDLPSIFLEVLEPDSVLRYLWVSHLRSRNAAHPADELFAEIAQLTPSLRRSKLVVATVMEAVHTGLESRLLTGPSPSKELYLAALARCLLQHSSGPLQGSQLQSLISLLEPGEVLSGRAHRWRSSPSFVESPIWNARLAAILLLTGNAIEQLYYVGRLLPLEEHSVTEKEIICTFLDSLSTSMLAKFSGQLKKSPFRAVMRYDPERMMTEGDLWRMIVDEIPVSSDWFQWHDAFMKQFKDAILRLDQRSRNSPLRSVKMLGSVTRGLEARTSLYGGTGDVHHLRVHRPGEDVRTINHRASARRESPVVTERQRDEKAPRALVVDIHSLSRHDSKYRDSFFEQIAFAYRFNIPLHIVFIGRGVLSEGYVRFLSTRGTQASMQDCEEILEEVSRQVYRYQALLREEATLCNEVLDYSGCLTLGESFSLPARCAVVLLMSRAAQRKNSAWINALRVNGHSITS